MTYQPATIADDQITLAKMPGWLTARAGETPQNVAFLSGASFAMLDMILQQSGDSIPKALLSNNLAMKAAVATSKLEGRMAQEADIRDAYHLTPPDEEGVRHWGPDGDVLDFWRRAGRVRLGDKNWIDNVAALANGDDRTKEWLETAVTTSIRLGPMAAAVEIMCKVLKADDRAERLACFLADVVIAKFFGWDRLYPLSALHLTKAKLRDLRDGTKERKCEPETTIEAAITKSAQTAFRLTVQLNARAEALRSVAPKLRTRGSEDAVALFLAEDAVAPSGMLSPLIRGTRTPMTGRAARRLCDRLVEFGVVKELTGRPTFRLYGLAP
ncbi:DUF1403 family protein [Ahrensia sp. 13_GOM-1096m]|uniref:DUF1403 family protein n=1 Tax=Ahrensia sp. 13_GOM-1096m TaxID=1380380 RepID=UPI000479DE31|nr:DUF1403 family protein [Ahrensia sp. 13_GOM-1096m]